MLAAGWDLFHVSSRSAGFFSPPLLGIVAGCGLSLCWWRNANSCAAVTAGSLVLVTVPLVVVH